MIFDLISIFEKMGIFLEFPDHIYDISIKNPSKARNGLMKRFLKRQISKKEFCRTLDQINLEEKQEIAEVCVDDCLKNIFDQFGITLSDEMLFPFRNAIIQDTMIGQQLVYTEVMKTFFDEMDVCTDFSFKQFMCFKLPKLVAAACLKFALIDPSKQCADGANRLMEQFCYTILNAKADAEEGKN